MKLEIQVFKKANKKLEPLPGHKCVIALDELDKYAEPVGRRIYGGGSSPRVAAMRAIEQAAQNGWF